MRFNRVARCLLSATVLVVALTAFAVESALAIPTFSRKYKTSCVTCHYAYPQLNGFGNAFRNNGYRYPENDRDMVKEPPVSLGSESYKKVWPSGIWPSDIPGSAPISIQAIGRVSYLPNIADSMVSNTFELPHELEVLYGGTIGDDFSFFGEIEIENEDNEMEIAIPFRLEWNVKRLANFVIGSLDADATLDHHRLTAMHNNVASLRSREGLRLRGEKPGVGLWGAANGPGGRGGLYYLTGVTNGQGINDENSDKDVFAIVRYKIGGLGQLGGTEGQASETSAHYKDNQLTVGGFTYIGTAGPQGGDKEDVTMFGGILEWWYDRAILSGAVMSMDSSIPSLADRTSLAWYAQGQYVVYPWLIGLARVEGTDQDTDDTVDSQQTLVGEIAAMIRANVKGTIEYQRALNDHDVRKEDDSVILQASFGI